MLDTDGLDSRGQVLLESMDSRSTITPHRIHLSAVNYVKFIV